MSGRYGAIESCIDLERLQSVRRNFADDDFETYTTNQSLEFLCFNATGSPLTKGTVVYIDGIQGDKPKVVKADASAEATSSKVIGLVYETIPHMEEGLVIEAGELIGYDGSNLDTDDFTEGDLLWLSTTAGEITNVRPTQPDHSVFIGYCVRPHPNAGHILVNIQNGFELGELHDVLLDDPPTNGDVLTYNSSTGLWENAAPSGGGVEILGKEFTDVAVTDTTGNAVSVLVPAGKLGTNGDSLRVQAVMSVSRSAGTATIAPEFGANAIGSFTSISTGTLNIEVLIIRTSSTAFRAMLTGGTALTTSYTEVTGLASGWFDSARTFEFVLTSNNAGCTITSRFGKVEFLPSA
ncbi:MAG: hypothetical protein ACO24B_01590 [Ilumatobacteraceae bacterium]